MNNKVFTSLCGIMMFCIGLVNAQIITTTPNFPTVDDEVTFIYDATQGSAGLEDCNCTVYVHTGYITNNNLSGWQGVQQTWGTADADAAMTSLGNNMHSITFDVIDFYGGIPTADQADVTHLAFVFRNADGSLEGKTADFQDIYVDIYDAAAGFQLTIQSPEGSPIVEQGSSLEISAATSEAADNFTLSIDGTQVASGTDVSELSYTYMASSTGDKEAIFMAQKSGTILYDTVNFVVPETAVTQAAPSNSKLGINYETNTSITLKLYAPNKSHIFVLGDFNDWTPSGDYQMKKDTDGNTWWLTLSGLTAGEEYAMQYLVDGEIKIADPLSEVVLDGWNDQYIPSTVYPNLKPFPSDDASGVVTLLQPGKTQYEWQTDSWERPEDERMFVYELLVRDFLSTPSFEILKDTLDYLENLGVNAIELMPINEFEGNISWGYNPSFHMAVDKYYGSIEALKAFIDECHARNIIVIADVVFNHAFSLSPLCRLYWDDAAFKPTADNPWLNPDAKHPYNVGYDFNHESQATKNYVDRVLEYMVEDLRFDGFRFDLSKGFTQFDSGGNVGLWGNYDQSRVDILNHYGSTIWAKDPQSKVILEHFGNDSEENVLMNAGFMSWKSAITPSQEAAMGYNNNSNFWAFNWKNFNGGAQPHALTFMESHDEERVAYKLFLYGNSTGGYNTKDFETGMDRLEQVAMFFTATPGPKMMWQFGELGYDFSINHCPNGSNSENCRTDPKPIKWDYLNIEARKDLYNLYSDMLYLRNTEDLFITDDISLSSNGATKTLHLTNVDKAALALGNFDVVSQSVDAYFQHTGWWYDYITGDSIEVTANAGNATPISMAAGEYRFYMDWKVKRPTQPTDNQTEISVINNDEISMSITPNPTNGSDKVFLNLNASANSTATIQIISTNGQLVRAIDNQFLQKGSNQFAINTNDLAKGLYLVTIQTANQQPLTAKLIVK